MVKNLPADAGDAGLVPGQFLMPQSNCASASQLLGPWSRAWETLLLNPVAAAVQCCNSCSPWALEPVFRQRRRRSEKPVHRI